MLCRGLNKLRTHSSNLEKEASLSSQLLDCNSSRLLFSFYFESRKLKTTHTNTENKNTLPTRNHPVQGKVVKKTARYLAGSEFLFLSLPDH